ncbi:MAG: hypothetical protein J6O50_00180 [Ruminiclostridium sp.]|nr:hypothetical protein [Ruminiclostridium sp.]
MRNGKDRLFICAGYAGTAALFLLGVCYIFAALGLFSFGVVSVPCILLGKIGMLTVISDLAPLPLAMICGGALLAGLGMSLGIIPLCISFYGVYTRFARSAAIRRERMFNEEDKTS